MTARDLVHEELARAEESARVLDLLGRALVRPDLAENAEAIAEAAIERAAIAAEGATAQPAPGLVSTPTSVTRSGHCEPPHRVKASDAALCAALSAWRPDPVHKRIADLRKIVGSSARGHLAAPNKGGDDVIALTLTYRPGVEWEPQHIAKCLRAMRMWFERRAWRLRYVWVAELQERGAVHYHLALFVPRGESIPFADTQGWWPHGITQTERVREVVGYLMSYLGDNKAHQKDYTKLPKGCRAYGVGGLEEPFRRVRRWLRAPTFVRRLASIDDQWRRAPGGGWMAPTGEHFVSEFARVWAGIGYALVRVARHCMDGAMPEGVGPFSWLRLRNREVTC